MPLRGSFPEMWDALSAKETVDGGNAVNCRLCAQVAGVPTKLTPHRKWVVPWAPPLVLLTTVKRRGRGTALDICDGSGTRTFTFGNGAKQCFKAMSKIDYRALQ